MNQQTEPQASPGTTASPTPGIDTNTNTDADISIDIVEASISQLQSALTAGATTSRALTQAYLNRIATFDQDGPALNAIVALNPAALADADALDHERKHRGARGPLHGIPLLIKDNFDVLGLPTSAGAKALATLMPERDAFQVARLRAAGAVILGKTTMHELASGITNVSSLTGFTRNPYDPRVVPGGSSGGTGAAVAASFAAAGMGSDTSGSLRIPASCQNLVSLRTTAGLSSRDGVVPLSTTQDVAGPMARTVEDLAIMLDVTVGADPNDPSTLRSEYALPGSFGDAIRALPNALAASLAGMRIGVVDTLFGLPADPAITGATSAEAAASNGAMIVTEVVKAALQHMASAGATLVSLSLPDIDDWLERSRLTEHEFKYAFARHLARYANPPVTSLREILTRGLHHPQLDTVFRFRDKADTVDKHAYATAQLCQAQLRERVEALMHDAQVDMLAYPVLRVLPVRIGESQGGSNSQLSAATGLPAMAVPAGFSADGIPIGMELLGPALSDTRLVRFAACWERLLPLRRAPVLVSS